MVSRGGARPPHPALAVDRSRSWPFRSTELVGEWTREDARGPRREATPGQLYSVLHGFRGRAPPSRTAHFTDARRSQSIPPMQETAAPFLGPRVASAGQPAVSRTPLPPPRARRRPWSWGTLLATAALLASCSTDPGEDTAPEQTTTPNIVFIVVDTARADHFSCYGYGRPTTPRIDALASDGVLYTQARASGPWTLPAHASMLTGQPSGEHGLHWSGQVPKGPELPPTIGTLRTGSKQRLLANVLSKKGYTAVGISNNPWVSPGTELDFGFARFHYVKDDTDDLRATVETWPAEYRTGTPLDDGRAGLSLAIAKHDFDRFNVQAPYFLFVNLIDPHFPYLPAGMSRGRFGGDAKQMQALYEQAPNLELALLAGAVELDSNALTALYDEELAYTDAVVGGFLDWLRERGDYDDALIVVTSDHGEHLGRGKRYSHQLSVDDALLHVPLIVKYPNGRDAGTSYDTPLVSTTDLYQTLLTAAFGAASPVPGNRWSQNLADMTQFDRSWSLSEYYFSARYLAQLARANPRFEPSDHYRVLRVVVTDQERLVLEGDELLPPPTPGNATVPTTSPLPDSVRVELEDYVKRTSSLEASPGARVEDPETLEHLRRLGYVE